MAGLSLVCPSWLMELTGLTQVTVTIQPFAPVNNRGQFSIARAILAVLG